MDLFSEYMTMNPRLGTISLIPAKQLLTQCLSQPGTGCDVEQRDEAPPEIIGI